MGYMDLNEGFYRTHKMTITGFGRGYLRDVETAEYVMLTVYFGAANKTGVFPFFVPVNLPVDEYSPADLEEKLDELRVAKWGFYEAPKVTVERTTRTSVVFTWDGLGGPCLDFVEAVNTYFNLNSLKTRSVYEVVTDRFLKGQLASSQRVTWLFTFKSSCKLAAGVKQFERFCDVCLERFETVGNPDAVLCGKCEIDTWMVENSEGESDI